MTFINSHPTKNVHIVYEIELKNCEIFTNKNCEIFTNKNLTVFNS